MKTQYSSVSTLNFGCNMCKLKENEGWKNSRYFQVVIKKIM